MFKLLKPLKRFLIFLLSLAAAYITYLLLIRFLLNSYQAGRQYYALLIPAVFGLWWFTAYAVLPAIHRMLVKIYLPNYFIGRARTVDGLLADPINLAVIGSERKLRQVMKEAGWNEADGLTPHTSTKMIWRTFRNRSYPTAPVSPLYLFGFKQDLVFQQEVNNSPHRRHHVRFWKSPSKWWLPGGYKADWLGAATYDKRVGFSAFTLQFTHKIDMEIDVERDFVVTTLKLTGRVRKVAVVKHYASGFRSRNGGGDHISTDGNLPFIYLK
jgi:hypothetical protein